MAEATGYLGLRKGLQTGGEGEYPGMDVESFEFVDSWSRIAEHDMLIQWNQAFRAERS